MKSNRLGSKVAIVTGIGNGIGRGCALLFARHGAKVIGCDINVATADVTMRDASVNGTPIESVHPCDLTKPEDVRMLIGYAAEKYGHIDVLVNAAAWGAFVPIEQMDYEQHWKRTLTGELDIVFLACKEAWPYLKKSGKASIINFASANAYQALEGSPALAHCAGKGGVLAMTRQLALEGAPHGIRANSISPGLVETEATKGQLQQPGFREAVTEKHMLKRLGQPEDLAWAALFLASDEASWITAADLAVDGGATKW